MAFVQKETERNGIAVQDVLRGSVAKHFHPEAEESEAAYTSIDADAKD